LYSTSFSCDDINYATTFKPLQVNVTGYKITIESFHGPQTWIVEDWHDGSECNAIDQKI
jgi:hypothetical protein